MALYMLLINSVLQVARDFMWLCMMSVGCVVTFVVSIVPKFNGAIFKSKGMNTDRLLMLCSFVAYCLLICLTGIVKVLDGYITSPKGKAWLRSIFAVSMSLFSSFLGKHFNHASTVGWLIALNILILCNLLIGLIDEDIRIWDHSRALGLVISSQVHKSNWLLVAVAITTVLPYWITYRQSMLEVVNLELPEVNMHDGGVDGQGGRRVRVAS